MEVCRAYRNNGSCRYGDECKYEHSEGEPIAPTTVQMLRLSVA